MILSICSNLARGVVTITKINLNSKIMSMQNFTQIIYCLLRIVQYGSLVLFGDDDLFLSAYWFWSVGTFLPVRHVNFLHLRFWIIVQHQEFRRIESSTFLFYSFACKTSLPRTLSTRLFFFVTIRRPVNFTLTFSNLPLSNDTWVTQEFNHANV